MPKVNVDMVITNLMGEEIKDQKGDLLTAKTIIVNALFEPVPKDTGEEKYKKYELGTRVFKGGNINLSSEEIVLIKECIAMGFSPLVLGRIFDLLEGKD